MKFLYPQFLWALLALAVPLIIHLFNFRRYTTVFFSDTRLLQNVVRQSKSINRLKQWLIMLARMLALAMLVLAFANPYLPAQNDAAKPGGHASIYIDNSPSMLSGMEQASLLATARGKAVEVIKGLPQSTKVQILTNDFQGRQQGFYSKVQAIDLVDAIGPSYAFRSSAQILDRVKQAATDENITDLQLILISDFQKAAFVEAPQLSENWNLTLLPVQLENARQNLAIDSVWFEQPVLQPGFDQELQVRVSNSGGAEEEEVSLNLQIENALQGAKKLKVPAEGSATASFTIRSEKAAVYTGQVSLDAGLPFFDNKFYFSYSVARPFEVLVISESEEAGRFQRLFADSIFELTTSPITALDYSRISDYDLVVLNGPATVPTGLGQSLRANLEDGKNVVLIPAEESPEGINTVLANLNLPALGPAKAAAKAIAVQWNDPHFKNVFNSTPERPSLPNAEEHYAYSTTAGYPLISLEDGSALVSRVPYGQGDVILLSAAVSKTNLPGHPIFVPLLLNAALYSRQDAALYTVSGRSSGPVFYRTAQDDSPLGLMTQENEIIPRQRNRGGLTELYDLAPGLEPGLYPVQQKEEKLGFVAINPQPMESRWAFLNNSELEAFFGIGEQDILMAGIDQLEYSIQKKYEGIALWKWFVAAALLFLLLEIVLIKLWK